MPIPRLTTGDKAQYLATILWRNKDRFENHEGIGYWLKGVPLRKPGEVEFQFIDR